MFKGLTSLRLPITTKIILRSLPVIAIVSIMIWCPSIIEFQKRELGKYRTFAEKQAELIKMSLQHSMLTNKRDDIREVVKSVSSMENTLWIRVMDKDGTIKVSSRTGDTGKKGTAYEPGTSNRGKQSLLKEINGKKTLIVTMPVENQRACYTAGCHFHKEDDRVNGWIEMALNYEPINKRVWNQGITVASFGIIFTSVLVIMLYILVRKVILKRLIMLAEASRMVADGDLTVSVPASDEKDEIGQLIEVFNNMVSELRKRKEVMDMELNGYRQSLIQAQKMEAIGRLATGIAHDFNNILTGILGFLEMLTSKVRDKETKETLERIIQTAERGSDLTRQILLLGRKAPPKKSPLNLNTLIEDSFRMLRRMVEENIDIRLSLKKNIPPVNADQSQLTQVLMNLVINARDAIKGTGTITIGTDVALIDETYCRVHAEAKPGHYAVLFVRDTGTGIPDEIKDRIFDPFFTTKETGKGTGLGLAVSYGIATSHEGWISFYSEVRRGTEFKVYLPVCEDSGVSGIEPSRVEEIALSAEPHKHTILIIDDEEIIRDVGRSILESSGYRVVTASNGKEAVDIYRRMHKEINIVITDLVMPVMDGMATFEELKKINPDVKVIVSSGYSPDSEKIKGKGIAGFINKPFRVSEITKLVKDVLEGSG